jgi:signal peptidase I
MLQFLALNKQNTDTIQIQVLSNTMLVKLMLKRIGYLILLIYSTIFLAVAIPYSGTYAIGGFLCGVFLLRILNDFIKWRKFGNATLTASPSGISIQTNNENYHFNAKDITYLEVNFFSNLVIRERYRSLGFPLMLLSNDDREKLINYFYDMSPKRTVMFKKIWEMFDAILVAFILAMHIRQFIIQAYYIPTGSMEDTLLVGDHLLAEKITYGPTIPQMIGMKKPIHLSFLSIRPVQRGDIIIFRPPNEEEKDFIKRCIAVEGDEVHIEEGAVWVNGVKLDEPYVKGVTSYRGFSEKRIEGVVPKGMIVAMGDNRENSYDSRGFGYVPLDRIKGKAFILYWNTDNIKNFDFSRLGLIK